MKKNAILFLSLLIFNGCVINKTVKPDDDIFEGYNRKMFAFNNQVDKYVLKPIAQGYLNITNETVRTRVNSFLTNLIEPLSAGNHILQGDLSASGVNVARFGINSTLGLLGFFDVATGWGIDANRTGFDETLAYWCVADGPYIVLPIFGPSTPRTMVAVLANAYTNPVVIASNSISPEGVSNSVTYGYEGTRAIVARANAMPLLNDLEKNSIDYYSAMRSAFMQNRAGKKCFLGKKEQLNTYDVDFDVYE